jgi:hypothetical protein
MLIAQATVEGIPIVSMDSKFEVGSNPVAPTLTGRIEFLSSVRPVFLFRFGRDANGRSVAEKL